jgi:hypothetical protein
VTLNGRHTFCNVEDPHPGKGSGGVGLCSEFGYERTIGFEDAEPGEPFIKPGVGLLKRDDNPVYSFGRDYEIITPIDVETDVIERAATFTVKPLECRGYGLRQVKTITVDGNCLIVRNLLENVGEKPIHTDEYAHNFMAINERPIGPDYRFRFPNTISIEPFQTSYFRRLLPPLARMLMPDFVLRMMLNRILDTRVLSAAGRDVTLKDHPTRPFYCRLQGYQKNDRPQWELTYLPSGLSVRETVDFAPSRLALWGTDSVISAEVFIDIDLLPGESLGWMRRYEFNS